MKFHARLPFLATLVPALLIAGVMSAHAGNEGGAGVRGGGTGLRCAGDALPIMLEEDAIRREGRVPSVPSDRAGAKKWLTSALSADSVLSERVLARWDAIGDFDSWPRSNRGAVTDVTELKVLAAIQAQIDFYVHGTGQADPNWTLVHDDFAEIPAGCSKVQISVIENGEPRREYDGKISDITRRVAEIHEALYLVGIEHYDHELPGRSRDLIVALDAGRADRSKKELKAFVTSMSDSNREVFGLNRILVFSEAQDGAENCPVAISFASDGKSDRVVTLEGQGSEMRAVVRQPRAAPEIKSRPRPKYGLLHSVRGEHLRYLYFPDEERSLFPGRVNLFDVNFASNDYMLRVMTREYARRTFGFDYPRIANEIRGSSGGICRYKEWRPTDIELDAASLVKAWNSILLNYRFGSRN